MVVDETTITTEENYESKIPKQTKVLYTYGMRIVGGSRMHMAIAMELLDSALKDRVRVLGGDTDSMKISCDEDVSPEDLERALEPIAAASTAAIDLCMRRVRETFPDLASGLNGIGGFEIENRDSFYPLHFEMWNKARTSYDGKRTHITCAGLPRPIGAYTVESFMDELIVAGHPAEQVLQETLGFDTLISNDISHTLEHRKPKPTDLYDADVTDYRGVTSHVSCHQSIALYPASRWLGETAKLTNRLSVEHLAREYGRIADSDTRYLTRDETTGRARLLKEGPGGIVAIMEA